MSSNMYTPSPQGEFSLREEIIKLQYELRQETKRADRNAEDLEELKQYHEQRGAAFDSSSLETIANLERERDQAFAERDEALKTIALLKQERQAMSAQNNELSAKVSTLQANVAKHYGEFDSKILAERSAFEQRQKTLVELANVPGFLFPNTDPGAPTFITYEDALRQIDEDQTAFEATPNSPAPVEDASSTGSHAKVSDFSEGRAPSHPAQLQTTPPPSSTHKSGDRRSRSPSLPDVEKLSVKDGKKPVIVNLPQLNKEDWQDTSKAPMKDSKDTPKNEDKELPKPMEDQDVKETPKPYTMALKEKRPQKSAMELFFGGMTDEELAREREELRPTYERMAVEGLYGLTPELLYHTKKESVDPEPKEVSQEAPKQAEASIGTEKQEGSRKDLNSRKRPRTPSSRSPSPRRRFRAN